MTAARSRTGAQLVKAATAAGWSVNVTPGVLGPLGRMSVLDPDRPYRGDGTRPEVHIDVPCETEALRICSPDGRHHARVILATLDGKHWDAADTPNAWAWSLGQVPGTPGTAIGTRALLAALKTLTLPAPTLLDPTEREASAA